MLTDRSVDSITRSKLRIVAAARLFAKDSIKLKTKESFTTYAQMEHDTLVLVLSAAYRDTLAPYTWWFPIVGRVPYKGYFDFAQAKRDAHGLETEGYDTRLGASPAYSTLGFFNDPVMSGLVRHSDSLELANTVIHEVTHNTFYAPGQATFNESFASFVGARGAAAFFRSRGDTASMRRVDARWEDDKRLGAFWGWLAHALDSAYAAHRGDKAARLVARDSVYAMAQRRLIDSVGPTLTTIPTQYLGHMQLNNAALLARRVYYTGLDLFDAVWEREGRDVRRAVQRIIALAKSRPADPYGALRAWLAQ